MEKVPTVSNLALKSPEIVSVSKQKFYICNQKDLKLTTTIPNLLALVKSLKSNKVW